MGLPRLTRASVSPPGAGVRSARLLFSDALADGRLAESDLVRAEVLDGMGVLSARPVPPLAVRYGQRIGMKRDPGWSMREGIEPMLALRKKVLGDGAPAAPRFVVRVDEYPLAGAFRSGDVRLERSLRRFHATLADAGVPYLMAVTPEVSRDYLDPVPTAARPLSDAELDQLHGLVADGVELGLHGFDHRTRDAHPRRHSELAGLEAGALTDLLDRGMERLHDAGLDARIFVPPFNRFDPQQYDVLAERFDAVSGGPETVPLFGFHRTPLWRGEAAYVPAYAPFYGRAAGIAEAARRSIDAHQGLWIPIVLHWSWEMEAWEDLERLAGILAGHAHAWSDMIRAGLAVGHDVPFVAATGSASAKEAGEAPARTPRASPARG